MFFKFFIILFGNIINEFFSVLCVKKSISQMTTIFLLNKYKYFFKPFSFSVATLYINLLYRLTEG